LHVFVQFNTELTGLMFDPDKRLLLNSSMLVTAVAVFETLLGHLLTLQLRTFPGLLDA
jgi:hypothetical protein